MMQWRLAMLRPIMFAAIATVLARPIHAETIHAETVYAETWPTRPLTMVVPFAAGGPMDAVARILQSGLSDALRQQVIIENVGGAGGMIGAARVAKAAPDGYEFALGNVGTHAVSQSLYKAPLYDAARDFTPVILIADLSLVLLARRDLPPNTLQEFIAYAKTNQDKMQFASAGVGSATHLGCALINARIGVNITHIPYRGGAHRAARRLSVHRYPDCTTPNCQRHGQTDCSSEPRAIGQPAKSRHGGRARIGRF